MKPIVINLPEESVFPAELVGELRSIRDEIRVLVDQIKEAGSGDSLFWTESDLAEMFKCSELTIKRERRAGKIPFKRVGGKPVFTRKHIEEFLSGGN